MTGPQDGDRPTPAALPGAAGARPEEVEGLRRMALVDEMLGLRAQVAQMEVIADGRLLAAHREIERLHVLTGDLTVQLAAARAEQQAAAVSRQALAGQLDLIRRTPTWRIGKTAMAPIRWARFARRTVGRVGRG